MTWAVRTLVSICFVLLLCCRAADPTAFAVVQEWKDRAEFKLATVVDEAEVIVAAKVTNAEECQSSGSLASQRRPPDGIKLGCAALRVIQTLRGDPSETDIEVLYLDHRSSKGNAMLRRMPIGANGSTGIYLLNRRGGKMWASLAEQRSYFPVRSESYIPYSRHVSINEAIAANLLGSNVRSTSAASKTVLMVSAAIQLTDLYRVTSTLERLTKSEDRTVAISACILLTAQFGKFVDCAPRFSQMGTLSPESMQALESAVAEGGRQVMWLTKVLGSSDPVILLGLLNSAPGGACEFVRLQLNHSVDSVRLLARARVEDTCRFDH